MINWKYNTGERVANNHRDVTITDKKYVTNKYGKNVKYYKYICNICGFTCKEHYKNGEYKKELWVIESSLNKGYIRCPCCMNKITVVGINDIPTTAPFMIKFFQRGYDEAKMYTKTSNQKISPICPHCLKIKDKSIAISHIYTTKSISCSCNDNIPYTEKFMFSVLEQTKLEFMTQLTKTTFDWCREYRYDFYFKSNGEHYIIETHGEQHFEETRRKGARTLKEETLNDRLKKELALKNGIKEENYIIIDCRYSELEFIKQNILKSDLAKIFNLNEIDWLKAEEFALSNLVKVACNYKRNNTELTTSDIGNLMGGYSKCTIRRWLVKGNKCGLCEYNSKQEHYNSNLKNNKIKSKAVICIDSGAIFNSISECCDKIYEILGYRISRRSVSLICNMKKHNTKGLMFRFISDMTEEEILKIQSKAKLDK